MLTMIIPCPAERNTIERLLNPHADNSIATRQIILSGKHCCDVLGVLVKRSPAGKIALQLPGAALCKCITALFTLLKIHLVSATPDCLA